MLKKGTPAAIKVDIQPHTAAYRLRDGECG